MNIGRTILVLLVALSVAMLPAAAGLNIAVKSTDMAETADMADVTEMAAMEDMDCCPHKAKRCDDCSSMATCPLTHFGFFATSASDIIFPSVMASLSPLSGANAFHPQEGSPPFRPPRV
jgi:hypothetical protein